MNTTAATQHHTHHLSDESGQTMAEYGVMIALITLGVVGAFMLLNGAVLGMFGRIAGFLGA
jgi:Flp pilus assembly pilin Flp